MYVSVHNVYDQYVVLATCYPELKLSVTPKAKHAPYWGYWKDINNQRNFLESIAPKLGILPLEQTAHLLMHKELP